MSCPNTQHTFDNVKNKSFYISFANVDWVRKKDKLSYGEGKVELKVLKVYRNTLWRIFARKLGFKVRINQVEVIKIKP